MVLPAGSSMQLRLLAGALERSGAEILELELTDENPTNRNPVDEIPVNENPTYETIVDWPVDDDWLAVASRSVRLTDRSAGAYDQLEADLRRAIPLVDLMRRRINAPQQPLICLGSAATIAALGTFGSYVAVTDAVAFDPADRLGLEAADHVVVLEPSSRRALAEVGIVAAAAAPLPIQPPTSFRQGAAPKLGGLRIEAGDLVVVSAEPLDPAMSFTVLQTLAELHASTDRTVRFSAPHVGDDSQHEQFTEWVTGLGLDAQVSFFPDATEATIVAACVQADVLLSTAQIDGLRRTVARAAAAGTGVVSLLDLSPLPDELRAMPVQVATDAESLAAAIRTASTAAGRPPAESDLFAESIDACVITPARRLAADPGPAHQNFRQRRWEVVYEAASVDDYEANYHDAWCYQALDTQLAQLLDQSLSDAGIDGPARVLDLGCGPGSMIPPLQRLARPLTIIGTDISPAMLREAERRFPAADNPDISYALAPSDVLPVDDDTIDAVLISGVLHHLPSLTGTLQEITRVLRPGGVVVIREPNDDNFALRRPVLAYVHQVLRSLMLDGANIRPNSEPDAHDDHVSFTPIVLARALATTLDVTTIVTAGACSYFYDAFGDTAPPGLDELEDSISNQAGLNVMMVATHPRGDNPTITDAAAAQLDRLGENHPVAATHIDLLFDLAREHMTGSQVAVAPDNMATIPLSTPADAAAAHTTVASLPDHGWIAVDIHQDAHAGPAGAADELLVHTVVSADDIGDGPISVIARKNALTPGDMVAALENLLDHLDHDVEPTTIADRTRWQRQVDLARLRADASWPPGTFRRLGTVGAIRHAFGG